MVWEARKRLPFRFGRWHGRLLDCPPPPLFGNRHRRARDVAIHATFCARTVADPTSEQGRTPWFDMEQSRYRAAISAAQRQSRCRRGESAENPQGNSTRTVARAQAWFLLRS